MFEFKMYRPKPFYTRWWFVIPMFFIVCAGIAAVTGWLYLQEKYGSKVGQFDFEKLSEMESASLVFDRQGNIMGRFFVQNRDTVTMDKLSPDLIRAVIAAEDNRYYEHHGVDFIGIARAGLKNWRANRKAQGGSTITQQLARNTFQMFEKSYDRKLLEIFLAWEIEKRHSKPKILELYLNRVFFGSGFFGAESASRGYFGKPASDLTLSECATLAGLLKNPNGLSPWSNRAACIESRNFVLGRLLELKMISQDQYQQAFEENLAVKNRRPFGGQGYAMEMVRQQVSSIVGSDAAVSEGYRIYTTIDPGLQKTTEESLKRELLEVENRKDFDHQTYSQYVAALRQSRNASKGGDDIRRDDPEYLQGAAVVLENTTGAILAIVGGRDFAHSQFNRVTLAPRPAGTAFKPLVYAAAFEKGLFPGTLVDDSVIDNRQVMIGGVTGILGEWGPERAENSYEGEIPARSALVKSKNAATVRLGMEVGIDGVLSLAKAAGIDNELRRYPATFLGSSEVTLMEMALAYTMFPSGGVRASKPFIVEKIEEKNGRLVFRAHPSKAQVIKDSTAFEINSCLAESLEIGTGDKAFSKFGLRKFPVSGKTGTAYNFTDVWFLGYSSAITCGVWAGFDKPRTSIYRGAFSSQIALPVWVDVMNASFQKYPAKEIPQPPSVKRLEICTKSGAVATPKCNESSTDKATGETVERRTTYFEWCTPDQTPKFGCHVHGDGGLIASSSTAFDPITGTKPTSQAPRAQLAVDLSAFPVIPMKGPAVVGDFDPFDSEKPPVTVLAAVPVDPNVVRGAVPADPTIPVEPTPTPSPDEPRKTPGEKEIRRAEPAKALEQQPSNDNMIKLDVPPPMEF